MSKTFPEFFSDGLVANVVCPGDTVILNYPGQQMDQKTAHDLKMRAAELLPEGVKVLIVTGATVTIARGDKGEPA